MTREDQLKICYTCKNRGVSREDHETICKLTNARADFDGSCSTYAFDATADARGRTVYSGSDWGGWRLVLSLVLIVFTTGRLLYKCNKSKDRRPVQYESREDVRSLVNQIQSQNNDQLASLDQETMEELGVTITSEDSVINIDGFMDFSVPADYYLMSNLTSDTVKMIIRDKRNYTTAIHRYPKSIDNEQQWISDKRKNANQIVKSVVLYQKDDNGTLEYSIKNALMDIKGRARFYNNAKYSYVVQCEHSGHTKAQVDEYLENMEKRVRVKKSN
jgi:hypothetical protein